MDSSYAYFFSDLKQAREGFVPQPYADINFDVYADDDGIGLPGINFPTGQWNSLNTDPSWSDRPSHDPQRGNIKPWYESHFFGGFTLDIDNCETTITYPSYLGQSDSFGLVQEISFESAMDG